MKKTIIKNSQILYGEELEVIQKGAIIINEHGIIEKVVRKSKELEYDMLGSSSTATKTEISIIDAEGFVIIPGFINSHTHIGDSIGKDIAANLDLNKRIHPHYGIKKTILEKTPVNYLIQMMRNAALSMLYKGITTFVDFREGGLEGINLMQKATRDLPIKRIVLGRIDFNDKYYYKSTEGYRNSNNKQGNSTGNNKIPSFYQQKMHKNRIKNKENKKEEQERNIIDIGNKILEKCEGFGISGANEYTDLMLSLYRKIVHDINLKNLNTNRSRKSLLAIHAAEAQSTVEDSIKKYKKTEIKRTLQLLDPDIYIHVTNPTKSDLRLLHKRRKKIIVCPRANGILGVGLGPIKKMLELDFLLGIGTDNIMLNSPDMFKEMDFLIKSQRAIEKNTMFLKPKDILKMATVNGGKIFNLNTGCIKKGYLADLLFIDRYDLDLYPLFDLHMALVSRCTEKQVKAVMINGKLTSGSIPFD
ncbi:amidohydrolase family protein [Candidatus Nitrosocosmicus franklandus]|uniref:Amidohydrolase n=1 Tax=Candidatus Nitrosocosmicus franklandianus TaxID=1798806 RepID=A0A484I9C3_9ARCH|nr:amidohydrolase family protein [Candidatus Nitrosocosmicus franklandus]VFJ13353.1 Putative amidohydrolase [Candidatus Nitrosocosmicus franklandus]